MSWKHHKQIHAVLRKHHPGAVHEAKKLVRFKYPKLVLLVLSFALAYYLFQRPEISAFILNLGKDLNLFGSFIAGIFLAFGFLAPLGIGFFLSTNVQNIILATILGGLGAMVGDMIIFKSIKFSFLDEFKELEKTPALRKIAEIVRKKKHVVVLHYLLYIFAGLVLATPLPDEIGVAMLAGLTTINPVKLLFISFFVHSIAIFLMLSI